MNLNDKVAIITGAGSGIGRATAISLSNWGCKLCLIDRNENTLNETVKMCKGGQSNIVKIVGDLNDENCLHQTINECTKCHGKLDILINNAAKFQMKSNLMETKMEDFDKIMNTNVRSIVILTKLCVPHLMKTKGCIVNVSSSSSAKCVGALPYSLSKAALDRLTKVTALELAQHGIRVNSVNTGHVVTKMRQQAGWSEEESRKYFDQIGKLYPLGRIAKPEEIAHAIAFLASDSASFITGETLRVDGGLSCTCSIENLRCEGGSTQHSESTESTGSSGWTGTSGSRQTARR